VSAMLNEMFPRFEPSSDLRERSLNLELEVRFVHERYSIAAPLEAEASTDGAHCVVERGRLQVIIAFE
jgi:hypothetical protein